MSADAKPTKLKDAVRIVSFRVVNLAGGDETYKLWHVVARECQVAFNLQWQSWLMWHFRNGSRAKLRAWLDEYAVWAKAKEGKERVSAKGPPNPVECYPAELGREAYAEVSAGCPNLEKRTQVLLMNAVRGKIVKKPPVKGNRAGWISVLLGECNIPQTVDEYPIPFDKESAELILPQGDSRDYKMKLRSYRLPPTDGKKSGTNVTFEFTLAVMPARTDSSRRKAKLGGQIAVLRRIAMGEYAFRGSNLIHRRDGWYAQICYSAPVAEKPKMDEDRIARLLPGRDEPFVLLLPDNASPRFPGGYAPGRTIPIVRSQLMRRRHELRETYRSSDSNRMGHGRRRAEAPYVKLTHAWKNFTQNTNRLIAKDAVRQLVSAGVGTLIYYDPMGNRRDTRYVATAGKSGEMLESSGWDFYGFSARIAELCQAEGITLNIKKCAERKQKKTAEAVA